MRVRADGTFVSHFQQWPISNNSVESRCLAALPVAANQICTSSRQMNSTTHRVGCWHCLHLCGLRARYCFLWPLVAYAVVLPLFIVLATAFRNPFAASATPL